MPDPANRRKRCKAAGGALSPRRRAGTTILSFESVGDRMKRFICWALMLCLVCAFGSATAQDTWTCANCGSEALGNFCSNCGSARPAETWTCTACGAENQGNFCSNCGAAKPDGKTWQCPVCGESVAGGFCTNCAANGLNGDRLTYYYIRSVSQDLDSPYLTNLMRWRDGDEETSGLAVVARDPRFGRWRADRGREPRFGGMRVHLAVPERSVLCHSESFVRPGRRPGDHLFHAQR